MPKDHASFWNCYFYRVQQKKNHNVINFQKIVESVQASNVLQRIFRLREFWQICLIKTGFTLIGKEAQRAHYVKPPLIAFNS